MFGANAGVGLRGAATPTARLAWGGYGQRWGPGGGRGGFGGS